MAPQALTPTPPPPVAPIHPSLLNGDLKLSPAERRAYLAFHANRNARRAAASAAIPTFPGPARPLAFGTQPTPSRIAASMFFRFAAEEAVARFGTNPVTILDLGCGHGNALEPFAALGMRGRYVGIDIARHPKWVDSPFAGFTRELLVHDIHTMSAEELPCADIVTSCTALEHIRDDAWAVRLLASRTRPGGMHIHAVPAGAALPLYGTHGWRQYAPADLEKLCPGAAIYRYGGPCAHAWHAATVRRGKRGERPLRETRPGLYALVREIAMAADRIMGDSLPTIYGVIWNASAPPSPEAGPRLQPPMGQ
jgi:2-polyprenyl-3-methyl-5-hydroxy-6-metoxy-1,4-benzoquinol methylase